MINEKQLVAMIRDILVIIGNIEEQLKAVEVHLGIDHESLAEDQRLPEAGHREHAGEGN